MHAPAPAATPTTEPSPESAVNGKFTTSNFVESVVTPSGSVFGDPGKSSKKRKSQVKDENPVQPSAIVSPACSAISLTDDKRLKVDLAATPIKTEPATPSVVVKVPSTTTSTSPTTISPVTRPTTTTSPIAATSSIVVSVPLAVASLPSNPVTTAPAPPTATSAVEEVTSKRARSQSTDKSDKGRKQKRGSSTVSKRGGRNSQATPPPLPQTQASPTPPVITNTVTTAPTPAISTPTPVVMPVNQVIKESPPSSPDSKQKIKKQCQTRDEKEKLFQNGVSAPHMLGNQLNPASTMAQKMSDTLSQELEAHSIFTSEPNLSTQPGQLVGPQLHSRVIASVRGSGAGTPQSSGTPPASAGWGPNNTSTPQTLDQLLERQWEQGSQFLMEQAQHFDSMFHMFKLIFCVFSFHIFLITV
ncbi:Protein AF-17, variant 2 [Homalodisca vitripennis]|nr:Protein AF-17, variant 2 [Homalodisca vitripennis]